MHSLSSRHYSLTSPQSDIFYHQQQFPNVPLYNVCGYNKLIGPLDVARYQKAYHLLTQVTDVFALSISHEQQWPQQNLGAPSFTELELIDYSDSDCPKTAAEHFLKSYFASHFELAKGGLCRGKLLRLSDNEHWFALACHHSVIDGWGSSLFTKKLGLIYSALSEQNQDALSQLLSPPPFLAEVEKSVKYEQSSAYQRAKQYWLEKFSTPPNLALPARHKDKFKQLEIVPSKRLHQSIPFALSNQLKQFAAEQQQSLQTLLLAAVYSYFAKVYRQQELVIGVTLHNRNSAKQKDVIGMFAAMSPLLISGKGESDSQGEIGFTELLEAIGKTQRQDFRHQKFPIGHLNRELKKQHKIQSSLFDIAVNYLKLDFDDGFSNIRSHTHFVGHGFAQLPLAVNLTEFGADQPLELQLDYNLGYWCEAEAELLMARLLFVFEQVLLKPDIRLSDIDVIPLVERQKIDEFADYQVAHSEHRSIVEIFEGYAAQKPDATLVISGEKTFTYRQINQKANQLARLLSQNGVTVASRVGICANPGEEMIIALLAAFKLGAAYVPLDPGFVQSRLDFMVDDAALECLLTQSELAELFAEHKDIVVLLDGAETKDQLEQQAVGNLSLNDKLSEQDIAYLIYTSGSTGQPKGVMVEQRNLNNYLHGIKHRHQISEHLSYAVLSTLATDLGNTSLYLALVTGGSLHLLSEEIARDSHQFAQYTQQYQIDVLKLTPNHFDALYDESLFVGGLPCRYLFLGGEALLGSAFDKVTRILREERCTVINHYGPTEATIGCLTHELDINCRHVKTPIGKPLANMKAQIVDADGEVQPIGAVGELLISGPAVTRGYLNRDDLTAERYVQNEDGSRGYYTGDLVRMLVDGNIEFVGRNDAQVKIRGYRVELGEIEYQLTALEGVEAAVVLLSEDDFGNQRLVAYVVLEQQEQIQEQLDVLKGKLNRLLPAHMVPEPILSVPELQLTANGKVDRKALPDVHFLQDKEYVEPTTSAQKLLVQHVAELLNIPYSELSISANFFELGGDSIISIQLVSRIRQAGWQLTGKDVFDAPTIQMLANAMKPLASDEQHAEQETLSGQIPLMPIQHWFFADETENHHYNQSVLLEPPAGFKGEYLKTCVDLLYQRHDALRLGFAKEDGLWRAAFTTVSDKQLADSVLLVELPEQDFSQLAPHAEAVQASLSLSGGNLFKAVYYTNAAGQHRLLLVCHHLVVDGISWRVILADLEQSVLALSQGEQPSMMVKTSSLRSWAERLQNYAQSDELLEQKAYWLSQQDNHPVAGNKGRGDFVTERFELDEKLTGQLLHRAGFAYHTQVNELLLAGLLKAYLQHFGEMSMTLNLEGHGRENIDETIDLSQTLGWFTAIYPLTLTTQSQDWRSLICQVKESYRAVPQHGLGFGVLKYLRQDPEIMALSEPQMVFNYLGQFDNTGQSDSGFTIVNEEKGCSVSPLRRPKHDITINAMVTQAKLQFDLSFDCALFGVQSMQQFKQYFVQAINELVNHCLACEQVIYTPSDFPLAQVDMAQLDDWQTKHAIADIYPATAMQQGLIFHSQKDSGTYSSQKLLRFAGDMNVAMFAKAWQQLVDKHDVFRTLFVSSEQGMQQLVLKQADLSWQHFDITSLTAEQQQEQIAAYIDSDKQQGFDLAKAPLLRLCIWQLDETHFEVLWTGHHAITDGWCNPIIIKQVMSAYDALCRDEKPQTVNTRPYRDYIAWNARQDHEGAVQYWQKALSDIEGPTPLPQVVTGGKPGEFGELKFSLDVAQTEQLVALAKATKVTTNVLLQSAWAYLLSAYSGESSVVFGTTIAGRPAELDDVGNMVGLFIKTIPVRADIDRQLTLALWLKQLHTAQNQSEAFSYLSLPEIQQAARLSASESLFDSLLVVENYPMGELDSGLSHSHKVQLQSAQSFETSNYDLTVVAMLEQQLGLSLRYRTDKFSAEIAEQLLNHFSHLLIEMHGKAEQPIEQLRMLNNSEVDALTQAHMGAAEFPVTQGLHQIFEQQAALYPEHNAVTFEGRHLSYQTLNQKANQLAHILRARGIGSDDLVGLCFERSIEMVVAILAVLKAGGAYVPLDPAAPQDRLSFIIEDSGMKLLLCAGRAFEQLPECGELDVLSLNELDTEQYSVDNLAPLTGQHPDNLAYVIYTSGSTGKPKGVLVEHRQAVRLFSATQSQFGFNHQDVWCLCHSYAFDFSVWEIFGALLHGGRLVIVPNTVSRAYDELYQLLLNEQVTVFNQTPSAFAQFVLVDEQVCGDLALRYVIFGGEALNLASLSDWVGRRGDEQTKLINMYGITETTVHVTYRRILKQDITANRGSLIGSPIADLSLYILDSQMNPVPVGALGEMYVGGAGVTRGYLNRESLTAERFIENPQVKGERLYRTGDLARFIDDREIEYLGRIDDQVKIRGHRIELGEIHSQLLSLAQVSAAEVLAKKDKRGHYNLVAYVVFNQPQESEFIALVREQLRLVLPEYMIPAHFVAMDELPLTINGKIDKRALPMPELEQAQRVFVAPDSVEQVLLAQIWAELLSLNSEQISQHDSFFELGGHSLLSLRLLAQIQNRFDVALQIRDIFQYSTLQAQAGSIARNQGKVQRLKVVAVDDELSSQQTSFAQQRLWMVEQIDQNTGHYHIGGALELNGTLDVNALARAFSTIVARHESLRTCFDTNDEGLPVQVIKDTAQFDVRSMEVASDQSIEPVVQAFAQEPFDLSEDLMLRVLLAKRDANSHVLAVSMHHIASDEWSLDILLKEFTVLYQAYSEGSVSPLTPLEVQYGDYAYWQRNWLKDDVLNNHLAYWKQQLEDLPVVHSLPLDSSRPAQQTFNGAMLENALEPKQFTQLSKFCQDHGATLFMGIQTVFSALLARFGNQTDVVVGSPVANREQAEIAGLIGFFVNTLVLRTQFDDNPGFAQLLQKNKQMLLDAYSHQQLPFELIVEQLNPARSLSHTPLFQIMLVLQQQDGELLTLPDLTVNQLAPQSISAKYDLTLTVVESDDNIRLQWEYNSDLFRPQTIATLAGGFTTLLSQMLSHPQESVLSLPLLTDPQVVAQLCRHAPHSSALSFDRVHQSFEQAAELTPDAVALKHHENELTFEQLNAQANRLARYLVDQQAVKPGDRIGVCTERNNHMAIAILAILKAGGAYVPLDPAYPEARLSYMAQDAGLVAILSQSSLKDLTDFSVSPKVWLDELPLQRFDSSNLDLAIETSNLAYVIYTSGSTGQPKGVMVEHQSWCSYRDSILKDYAIAGPQTVLQFSSMSFDILVEELTLSIFSGGTLVLPENTQVPEPQAFWQKVQTEDISVVTLPTAYWHQLCGDERLQTQVRDSKLQLMIVGGEAISPAHLGQWQQAVGDSVRLLNTYGPTESTVVASFADVSTLDALNNPVPIGKPCNDTQLFVLDSNNQLLPDGVVGELHIASKGLARGYLNRDDYTCEKFIDNPYLSYGLGGERWYKTGDLVRWLPDGELGFVGRADSQVKVRGFRIELDEIKQQLCRLPQVDDAIVLSKHDNQGNVRLVGFVVGQDDVANIKQDLSQTLPEYMVPSYLQVLEAIPLTTNGKVDIKALPEVDFAQQQQDYVAPRNAIEQSLCEIFSQLLEVEQVGISDNFFELGGHSLLATRLLAKVRHYHHVELSMASVFAHQSVEQLAEQVAMAESVNLPVIERMEDRQQWPLSYAQTTFYLASQVAQDKSALNMPAAIKLVGEVNLDALNQTYRALLEAHSILRTGFVLSASGEPVQVIHAVENLDCTVTTQSIVQDELQQAIEQNAGHCFDLAQPPLFTLKLLQLDNGESVLLANLHHIICDGWSVNLLIEQFNQYYQSICQGKAIEADTEALRYVDHCIWQQQSFADAEKPHYKKLLQYWTEQLADAPRSLTLPVDHTDVVESKRRQSELLLSHTELEDLQSLARRTDGTLFSVLMAGLNLLMSKWTGEQDVVLGTVVSGREQSHAESMLGCFINILTLRTQMDDSQSLLELVKLSNNSVLGGLNHQALPFALLLEQLKVRREGGKNPLNNVSLRLLNLKQQSLTIEGSDGAEMVGSVDVADTQLELMFEAIESDSGLTLKVSFDAALFKRSTAEQLLQNFRLMLNQLTHEPQKGLSEVSLNEALAEQLSAYQKRHPKMYVASTFTAEPVQAGLEYWGDVLQQRPQVSFAPYNQVFQELLNPGSGLRTLDGGCGIIMMRWQDLCGLEVEKFEQNAEHFLATLKQALANMSLPLIVMSCPASDEVMQAPELLSLCRLFDEQLVALSNSVSVLNVVLADESLAQYPVAELYDNFLFEQAKIPYTQTAFAAFASTLYRQYDLLNRRPAKVIALDCDNTLWQGVCGEVGPLGIKVTEPFAKLQRFMLQQYHKGVVLCLNSKNNPEDVQMVFDQNPDMILSMEHIVVPKVNWLPKSENIKAIAEELNLGLDSFVFVDDDSVQCAEVSARLPQVLTLQLPKVVEEIPAFIDHVWPFDHGRQAGTGAERSRYYKQDRERQKLQQSTFDLKDFLQSLELKIDIAAIEPERIKRASELSQRTNQFNLSTIRHTQQGLIDLLAQNDSVGFSVNVSDRFGEYGYVGIVLAKLLDNTLQVTDFMLSCRAMGRGVEHAMVRHLGVLAKAAGKEYVHLCYRKTAKNQPALNFLQSIEQAQPCDNQAYWQLTTEQACEVDYISSTQDADESDATEEKSVQQNSTLAAPAKKADAPASVANVDYADIARRLRNAEDIQILVEAYRLNTEQVKSAFAEYVAPQNEVQQQLCQIWQTLLGLENIGIKDNFFDLGGHSLLATRVIAQTNLEFGIMLALENLFTAQSIEQLAELVEQQQLALMLQDGFNLTNNNTDIDDSSADDMELTI